jgi:hypothetical protein
MLYEILFLFLAFTIYYIMRYLWELIPVGGDRRKMAVLITGCDSGFGHLLALKCARKGMKVFAGCFTEQVRLLDNENPVKLIGVKSRCPTTSLYVAIALFLFPKSTKLCPLMQFLTLIKIVKIVFKVFCGIAWGKI